MAEAFICAFRRTPIGRYGGALSSVRADDLAAHALSSLISTCPDLDTAAIDDVILGCVDTVGESGSDIARVSALVAGYGNHVPGVQINRFCASGLDAVNFASAQVMSGQHDMAIGGGVESMSRVGMGSEGGAWPVDPSAAIPTYFMPQGVSADLIATKYGFSRDDVDAYAIESQKRAAQSWKEGRFARTVTPVRDINGVTILDHDEHMRPDANMQSLASLKPSFIMHGEQGGFNAVAIQRYPEVETINHVHHAGNSSGIVDGAAAILIGSAEAGKKSGLKPRAKIKAFCNIGSEPAIMLTGPVDVTKKLLAKTGMSIKDIDIFEVNEAFAPVPMAWLKEIGADEKMLNPNGGAIALGHPLGGSGARIMTTMLYHMRDNGIRYGLQTMCEGGGQANATILELL